MFTLLSQNGKVQQGNKEYVCDTEEDLKKLPQTCNLGDLAFIIKTGDVFMINSEGEWVKV